MAEKDEPNVVIMGRLGHLQEFDPKRVEAWPLYQERLNVFIIAHNISCVAFVDRQSTLSYARRVCRWIPYADIVSELTAHFTPCLSVLVQCFAFHKRSQQPGETIANFVTALRRFSEHCDFGETLSDMLWDRLVCGVLDKGVLRRPLGKPMLEFKKAFETANPSPLRICNDDIDF
ncbi:hypothetical protein HPB47_002491, partial [Ixodes persulcatus]